MTSVLRMLLPIAAVLALGGCVTATVQEVREAATAMGDGDSVVVLGRRQLPTAGETEIDFVSCVRDSVGSGRQGLSVIDARSFRDSLFPWFEPRTAPVNSSDLPELMAEPRLAARLEEMGLKYLVWIEGSTQRTEQAGSLTCSVTTAGAGCFGFLSWENDSSYEAQVWDIRNGNTVGRISSDAVGTSYMPAVVVPVPLIARVRNSACQSLSNRLKVFLTAES